MKRLKTALAAVLLLSLSGYSGLSFASKSSMPSVSFSSMLSISQDLAMEILTEAHPSFYAELGISFSELVDDYNAGICSITEDMDGTYLVTDGGITIQILIESG